MGVAELQSMQMTKGNCVRHTLGMSAGSALLYNISLSLVSWCGDIEDHHRNPNSNDRDHLVGD